MSETMICHNVYSSWKDNSDAAKQHLVAACHKYLTGHPGVRFYAAGTLAEAYSQETSPQFCRRVDFSPLRRNKFRPTKLFLDSP